MHRLALWLVNHCHDVACERRAQLRAPVTFHTPQVPHAMFLSGVTTADYELPAPPGAHGRQGIPDDPHSLTAQGNAGQSNLPLSAGIRSFITEFLVETLSWKVSAFSSNEELKRSASQSTSDEITSSTHTFTDCGLTFQSGRKLSCVETPAYSVPDGSERARPARVRPTTLSEVRTTSFSSIDPDVALIGSLNQDGSPGKQHYGTQYAL
ncbi:hypothetical protein DPX16_6676 [Anabarilius grahami]|uniref:Uncharacterized protein n=1 Tax=Anabarilius grahami TaxID=495550 RepID=A0A3N0YQN2_ANAGA|nr:hypothetical protein DPX16_6676 [Anabarilius grahami]